MRSMVKVSENVPDWSREHKAFFSWNPSRALLAAIRSYQRHVDSRNPIRILIRKFAVLRHHFWSVICGAHVPVNSLLGGGLLLPHPNGVVIHPKADIGPNCLIFQQVTIGTRQGSPAAPSIGAHVNIGAGAKILGPVRIGDFAHIGANAVVLRDVPPGATAVGIPAVIRARKGRVRA